MDTPSLQSWLRARLRYAVQLRAEQYLLNAALPDGLREREAPSIPPSLTPRARIKPYSIR
jgi:hypothetical protein